MQTFFFLTFTGDLFARINSANDFFIYVLVSRRYRNILYRIVMKYVACSKKYKNLNDIFRNVNSDVIETGKTKINDSNQRHWRFCEMKRTFNDNFRINNLLLIFNFKRYSLNNRRNIYVDNKKCKYDTFQRIKHMMILFGIIVFGFGFWGHCLVCCY